MTQPRNRQIDLSSTSFYHCMCRCVRQAFLCGFDAYSEKDYGHRRQWILERLQLLASLFATDVCAYAVMSNHVHLVLRVDKARAEAWDNFELADRWKRLYGLPKHVAAALAGDASGADKALANEKLTKWRRRLYSVSWFMKCFSEVIARMANEEDECTGRFWEGRFKSQPLLDERALLTCMAYVDLNPIRSKQAETPEGSDFTSVQERIRAWGDFREIERSLTEPTKEPWLLPFRDTEHETEDPVIPYQLMDYLQLVEQTGRVICTDKPGAIPSDLPPLLTRLGVDQEEYLAFVASDDRRLIHGAVGAIKAFAQSVGKKFFRNYRELGRLYQLRE